MKKFTIVRFQLGYFTNTLCVIALSISALLFSSCDEQEKTKFNNSANKSESGLGSIADEVIDGLSGTDVQVELEMGSGNYKFEKKDGEIMITSVSADYYQSGHMTTFDEEDFLYLRLFVLNNSEDAISVNSLSFEVEDSYLDSLPIVWIPITGPGDEREECELNSLPFYDESWFCWDSVRLDYKILKAGEKFDGKYDRSKSIDYFDGGINYVSFLDDLIEIGYDYNKLCSVFHHDPADKSGFEFEDAWESGFVDEDYSVLYERFMDSSLFYPFFEYLHPGDQRSLIAKIYGTLTFPNGFSVDFDREIILTDFGSEYGAGMNWDDEFEVELNPIGKNYEVYFPYTTVIEPGGSELVSLRINCPKSSHHKFSVRVNNDNGFDAHSCSIGLYYLNPSRHRALHIE